MNGLFLGIAFLIVMLYDFGNGTLLNALITFLNSQRILYETHPGKYLPSGN